MRAQLMIEFFITFLLVFLLIFSTYIALSEMTRTVNLRTQLDEKRIALSSIARQLEYASINNVFLEPKQPHISKYRVADGIITADVYVNGSTQSIEERTLYGMVVFYEPA